MVLQITQIKQSFLLCNAGSGAGGQQQCMIYLQIVAGAKGQISTTNNSKISLSLTSITASSSDEGYVTNPNINVNITENQPIDFVISQPVPNANSAVNLIQGVDILPANKAGLNLDKATGMTGVKCRVFNGETVPDAKYASSTYALPVGPETTQSIVKNDSSNEALFLLSGFHNSNPFNRAQIGYADRFTINYDITVVSSTIDSSQTCP